MVGMPSTEAVAAAFGVTLLIGLALMLKISLTIEAEFENVIDPSYPFLQAVSMHDVSGEPFMYYMSMALKSGDEMVEGVNVTEELMKFGNDIFLINSTGHAVISIGSKRGKTATQAIPPGGSLVISYD